MPGGLLDVHCYVLFSLTSVSLGVRLMHAEEVGKAFSAAVLYTGLDLTNELSSRAAGMPIPRPKGRNLAIGPRVVVLPGSVATQADWACPSLASSNCLSTFPSARGYDAALLEGLIPGLAHGDGL